MCKRKTGSCVTSGGCSHVPRRGALNSQSGGTKIATLCKARGQIDCICAGYLKLLLLFFPPVTLSSLSQDFMTICTVNWRGCCVFLEQTGRKRHQIPVFRRRLVGKKDGMFCSRDSQCVTCVKIPIHF